MVIVKEPFCDAAKVLKYNMELCMYMYVYVHVYMENSQWTRDITHPYTMYMYSFICYVCHLTAIPLHIMSGV